MNKLLFVAVYLFCFVSFGWAQAELPELPASEKSQILEQMLKYFLDADELTIETLPLHFVTIFNDLAKMNNITIDQALLLFKFGVQMPEQTSNKALPENSSNTTSSNNFDPEVREICENFAKNTTSVEQATTPQTEDDENSKKISEKYSTIREQFHMSLGVSVRLALTTQLCKLFRALENHSKEETNSIFNENNNV